MMPMVTMIEAIFIRIMTFRRAHIFLTSSSYTLTSINFALEVHLEVYNWQNALVMGCHISWEETYSSSSWVKSWIDGEVD